jgi:hypothetical protein
VIRAFYFLLELFQHNQQSAIECGLVHELNSRSASSALPVDFGKNVNGLAGTISVGCLRFGVNMTQIGGGNHLAGMFGVYAIE